MRFSLSCVMVIGGLGCGSVDSHMTDAPKSPDAAIDTRNIDAPLCAARPPNLVSWWTGEGHAMDIIGTNEGSLVGGTYAAGEVGQSFRLNGTNQYVTVNDSASLDFTTQMTVEAWIYPETTANARIIDKTTSGVADGYLFDILSQLLRFTGPNGSGSLVSANRIAAQAWSHVAFTYDGVTMRLYINGVEDAARGQTGAIPTNALAFTIGADNTHATAFTGNIDEVAVYDRGLTAAEIQAIHDAGPHGKCLP